MARSLEISCLETFAEVEVVIPAVPEGHGGGIWARSGFLRCPPSTRCPPRVRSSPWCPEDLLVPRASSGTWSILVVPGAS